MSQETPPSSPPSEEETGIQDNGANEISEFHNKKFFTNPEKRFKAAISA